jgi:hypothetical protein
VKFINLFTMSFLFIGGREGGDIKYVPYRSNVSLTTRNRHITLSVLRHITLSLRQGIYRMKDKKIY